MKNLISEWKPKQEMFVNMCETKPGCLHVMLFYKEEMRVFCFDLATCEMTDPVQKGEDQVYTSEQEPKPTALPPLPSKPRAPKAKLMAASAKGTAKPRPSIIPSHL